jgi:TonB family protein
MIHRRQERPTMRHLIAFAAAAACLAAPAMARLQDKGWSVLPAMRHAGVIYAVRTDAAGKIVQCQPIERGPIPTEIEAACAVFAARGVPATLTPARSLGDPASWATRADYPAGANRGGGTVQLIFEVDTAGKISDCRAYPASVDAALETAACTALSARGRFSPAMYKGAPAVAVGIRSVTFAGP